MKKVIIAVLLLFMVLPKLWGCGSTSSDFTNDRQDYNAEASLVYKSSMEIQYAENFTVDYYDYIEPAVQEGKTDNPIGQKSDGDSGLRDDYYTLLTVTADGQRFLVVPEGREIPENLDEDITVIKRPVKDVYLVASAVMDMFQELGSLDTVTFSGQKQENWYIEEAKEAMANGNMFYAGKYSKPDYELLVSEGCTLAIENRMILHSPEVSEKLEDFGIPVMIECSSYESHPLGRVEWIKFFGALLGKEDEAERIFEEQTDILERLATEDKTDYTVAFFYITSNGFAQVRRSTDYIPKMIELAGGRYIFDNLDNPEDKRSTINMQMEEFYKGAKDSDFLIYNSSIDGGVSNINELLDKCSLLADFKAVREGNVWCTTNDMYQQSLSIGYLMEDFHAMLSGEDEDNMHYLFHLD